jgi:hypothetical protein
MDACTDGDGTPMDGWTAVRRHRPELCAAASGLFGKVLKFNKYGSIFVLFDKIFLILD